MVTVIKKGQIKTEIQWGKGETRVIFWQKLEENNIVTWKLKYILLFHFFSLESTWVSPFPHFIFFPFFFFLFVGKNHDIVLNYFRILDSYIHIMSHSNIVCVESSFSGWDSSFSKEKHHCYVEKHHFKARSAIYGARSAIYGGGRLLREA